MGFTSTASDSCVYTNGSGNTYIVLTLFVDELLIIEPSTENVAEVRRMLMEKFAMTDLWDVSQILGIEAKCDKAAGTIGLKRFNMSDCNPVRVARNKNGIKRTAGRKRTSK